MIVDVGTYQIYYLKNDIQLNCINQRMEFYIQLFLKHQSNIIRIYANNKNTQSR